MTCLLVDTLPEPAYCKVHLPGAINISSDGSADEVQSARGHFQRRGEVGVGPGPLTVRTELFTAGWQSLRITGRFSTTFRMQRFDPSGMRGVAE